MGTMSGCPVPPSAFQRPALEGGPAFETPAKPDSRMEPPDRSASANSVESLKSPFASMSAEIDDLCLDDYLDEEEREREGAVHPGQYMANPARSSLSRPSGSSLKSTPSLPWSENSFTTNLGRSSLGAGTGSLFGELGNMSQAYSRGLDSVASTRASSIVPCIPEGAERSGSLPELPDVLPSPFSDPNLQTDDAPPAIASAANGAVPSPAFYNPLLSGLKSLSGSEANLYLQLTEELAKDEELTQLLGAVALPGPSAADAATSEVGGPPGGSGPNTELIDKLRHLLPSDSMRALLGQMATEAASRRQAAAAASAAVTASDASPEAANGSGSEASASHPKESANVKGAPSAGRDPAGPTDAANLKENVAPGASSGGAEPAPTSAFANVGEGKKSFPSTAGDHSSSGDVGEGKQGSGTSSGEHPPSGEAGEGSILSSGEDSAPAAVGEAKEKGPGAGSGEWAAFADIGGEKRKGSGGPPASQAGTEPLLAANAASSAPTE